MRTIPSICFFWGLTSIGHGQEPGGGVVEGRVLDAGLNQYVYDAKLTVEGTNLEAYTDDTGFYRLTNVPAGSEKVTVIYTGSATQTLDLMVASGQTTVLNINLKSLRKKVKTGAEEPVKLAEFTVQESREMSGTALAVNTQRYAANTKDVVSVDELGFTGDGDIAGALKFLPGVNLEQDPTGYNNGITLSGAPSANVPVLINGFSTATSQQLLQMSTANATTSSNQRTAALMQLSIANISRIEIERSQTPESPGSALGGYVNLVLKSAFEYAKPEVFYQGFAMALQNKLTLAATAAQQSGVATQIYPGGSITAILPVSSKLGFTVTMSRSQTPREFNQTNPQWSANYDATVNNGAGAYIATPNDPSHYTLVGYELDNFDALYTRNSGNITADYKLSNNLTLSLDYSQGYNDWTNAQRQIRWEIGARQRDLNYGTATLTSSQSGTPLVANSTSEDYVENNTYYQERQEQNGMGIVKLVYNGRVWHGEIGGSNSEAKIQDIDLAHGFFFSPLYTVSNAVTSFNNVSEWSPGSISSVVGTTSIDPQNFASLSSAGGFSSSYINPDTGVSSTVKSVLPDLRSKPDWEEDIKRELLANVSRNFDSWFVQDVKLGLDLNYYQRDQHFDPRLGTQSSAGALYTGNSVTLSQFINPYYNTPMANGVVPQSFDNLAVGKFFLANEGQFIDLNAPNDFETYALNSKFMHETVNAAYVRFDSSFFNNRLRFTYGVRYERTDDGGQGPLYNPVGNDVTNAAGQIVDSKGNVVGTPGAGSAALIYPSGSLPSKEDSYFVRAQAANISYGTWFPSLNASYDLTHQLIARASISQSIGRPDLLNLIPGIQFPTDTAVPSASNVFNVANTALQPWHSTNLTAALEYYSDKLGDVTLRAYRRFLSNAFTQTSLASGDPRANALLEDYGINPNDWQGYGVTTNENSPGTIVFSGVELSTRYGLDGLLPDFASGVAVKGTVSRSTITGNQSTLSNFGSQNLYIVPYSAGGDIELDRRNYTVRFAAKWLAEERLAAVVLPAVGTANPSVVSDPDTYDYQGAELRCDIDVGIRVYRNLWWFLNGRDINGYTQTKYQFSPATPGIARALQRNQFPATWTSGFRGQW